MKIIIAPDSFKGSLSASEVALAIEQGFSHALPKAEYSRVPMADGGEGTLDALLANQKLTLHYAEVTNPMGEKMRAAYGIQPDNTAVIEMATASGLSLVPPLKRNPLNTTTFGTGELILAALDNGCRKFIIGLGGSATCDGGVGALAALGVRFKNSRGETITPNAEGLETLISIDTSSLDPRLSACEFIVAHDVDNAFLGLEGALMYAPQKGATPAQVETLHIIFERYALMLWHLTQKPIGNIPGTGSAGGLAAGLLAFLNATLKPGASVVMENVNLREKMQNANLVITGEGQIDAQTIRGKTPIAVAKLAQELKIPVIGIAARLGRGYHEVYGHGIDAVFSMINSPISEEVCHAYTQPLLAAAANNIARLLALEIKK